MMVHGGSPLTAASCYPYTSAGNTEGTVMLTDKRVRGLSTEAEREDVFDGRGGLPGFGVRVWGKTGKKSFFLMYRAPDPGITARKRKLRRLKLGRYGGPTGIGLAEARRRAKAALGDVAAGRDPGPQLARIKGGGAAAVRVGVAGRLAEFLPEGYVLGSFGQLAAEYLSQHAWAKKRDPLPDERALRYRLLPLWADTPLSEIDRRRVVVYLDEVREASGPVAANRRHALLSKMWNFGLQRDLVSTNPVVGISKNRETPKDRYLAEDELRKLLPVLGSDPAHQVAKMILFTGMRPGEVLGMRWTDLEGDDWYNLPA